jgi:carbonic anhydrase/acetyltransferase-like protein (isoleucine patch superfamily)
VLITPGDGSHSPELAAGVFVATTAVIIGRVTIGPQSGIWFGTVLRGDTDAITIGAETNIQDLSVVHCDPGVPCTIGNRVTVGHRAVLHGCLIEDECIIGMGAVVQNRSRVGTHSIIAAGSVVREGFTVPPGTLAAGMPAVVKRDLTPEEIEHILRLADAYVRKRELYQWRIAPPPPRGPVI